MTTQQEHPPYRLGFCLLIRSRAVPLSVDAYHHLLELGLVDKKTELILKFTAPLTMAATEIENVFRNLRC